jgi:hypothetical protein
MTVMYDGTTFHASLLNSSGDTITINGLTIPVGGSGTLTTANIAEGGATNLYFSNTRARAAVSASDAGGLGSFAYNNSTGVFTYTGPSDSDIRGLISAATTGTGFGNLTYTSGTGVMSYERVTPTNIRNSFSATAPVTLNLLSGAIGIQSSPTFAGTTTVSGLTPTTNAVIWPTNSLSLNRLEIDTPGIITLEDATLEGVFSISISLSAPSTGGPTITLHVNNINLPADFYLYKIHMEQMFLLFSQFTTDFPILIQVPSFNITLNQNEVELFINKI